MPCVCARRVVLATVGSLGDLYPFIGLALALQKRGHQPVVATTNAYRQAVESAGVEFAPVRPHFGLPGQSATPVADGTEMIRDEGMYFVHSNILPNLGATYDDLYGICQKADLLINHQTVYVASTVAEQRRMPRATAFISPNRIWSIYDPPVMSGRPVATWLCQHSRLAARAAQRSGRRFWRDFLRPLDALRQDLGLPPRDRNPEYHATASPHLNLGLFSPMLTKRQRDWPRHLHITGFLHYDGSHNGAALEPRLADFLESGPPPVVFSLGSLLWNDAGDFFEVSVEVANRLGRRAIIITGSEALNSPAAPLPDGVMAVPRAPYSRLFPHAAAIVLHGGMGSLGQAMRAGRPMLVVPFVFDQPDNAARAERLGIARAVPRRQYTRERVVSELRRLLENPVYETRAEAVAMQVRAEDGAQRACDAIAGLP